jgi:hypothetical protein
MSDPARNARASTTPVEPTYNRNPARNPATIMNPLSKATSALDSICDGPPDPTKTTTSFDWFLELPAELRFKVYEQYALDDASSITTREWPLIRLRDHSTGRKLPFLPNVCFASKEIYTETGAALMRVATLEIAPIFHSKQTIFKIDNFSKKHAIRQVRKLRFTDFNDSAGSISTAGATLPDICGERARKSNAINSILLKQFDNLTEVSMHFHAAISNDPSLPRANRTHALSIAPYICRTSIPYRRQKGLQKITLSAESSYHAIRRKTGVSKTQLGHIQDDTVVKLLLFRAYGQRVKDAFKICGCDVKIEVRLLHSGECDVTTL